MPRSDARPGALRRAIRLATVASLLLLTVGVVPASAATLARFPTSNAPATVVGMVNPANAYADDGVYATRTLVKNDAGGQTFGSFGFDAIPAGSTIVSATAEIEFRFGSSPNDAVVGIQAQIGGTASGALVSNTAGPTADTTLTNANLGITARDQLLDGTFEVLVLATRSTAGPNDLDFLLDYVRVIVEYTVPDTTPPVVTVPADITTPATSPAGATVTFAASAIDDIDGALTPACSPASGDLFPIGATTVTCTATDAAGNTGSATFDVTVAPYVDQPPAIDPIADQTIAEGATGSVAVSASDPDGDVVTMLFYGANAGDPLPGFVTLDYPGGIGGSASLDLAPGFSDAGTYPITVLATNAGGFDTTTFTITVTNVDQPPAIDPIADQTIAEGATGSVAVSASDPDGDVVTMLFYGANAGDPLPGFVTLDYPGGIGGSASLDLAPGFSDAGTYPITVLATNAGGFDTTTFTITVTNTNRAPVASDQSVATAAGTPVDVTLVAADPDGDQLTYIIASQPAHGTVTLAANVATYTPDPGYSGPDSFTFTAWDGFLEASPATVSVAVADTTDPVVTVPPDVTTEAAGPGGAAVTFSASATDDVDGALTPTCVPASGSTFPLGMTTVTCSATDASGNTGTASFAVTVVDTTPPAITTPEGGTPPDLTVKATGPTGATVSFVLGATDGVDGPLSSTCSPAPGSLFPVGTTTVTCTATDRAGNVAGVSFEVTVTPYEGPVPTTPPTTTEGPAGIVGSAGGGSPLLVLWLVGMAGALGFLAVGVRRSRRA